MFKKTKCSQTAPDAGLGQPVRKYEDTFSAVSVVLEMFSLPKFSPPPDDVVAESQITEEQLWREGPKI